MKSNALSQKKGFTLIELMITIVIVGIISAVAIPAFLKFAKKSKIGEVAIALKAISEGSIAWFDVQHSDKNGDPLARHFPNLQSPHIIGNSDSKTPMNLPCSSGNSLYLRNSSLWLAEPWESLRFSISTSHFFQYRYVSKGKGATARFTILAHADLDCDKSLSTYQLRGLVTGDGEVERTNMMVEKALE